ncbi:MAG: hypothetical protein MI757_06680 [Pirellulales bacterium]|nr:hypothetical protein [Pirellulales bacterium]
MTQEEQQAKPKAKKASAFTGYTRQKKTRFSVKAGDFISTRLITIGGIGTIVAVSLVGFLLVMVAWPLFSAATIERERTVAAPWAPSQRPLHVVMDEYQTVAWAIYPDGSLASRRPT